MSIEQLSPYYLKIVPHTSSVVTVTLRVVTVEKNMCVIA